MAEISNTGSNIMSEYLLKLQLIVTNTEFMNKEEADKYETSQSKIDGISYVEAIKEIDTFESYDWNGTFVKLVLAELGYDLEVIQKYLMNPDYIPTSVRTRLLQHARIARIANYVEPNKYYLNLSGLPMEGADPIIMVPYEFAKLYTKDPSIHLDQPIHEMPRKYQELFMNTDYYKDLLQQYPNVEYIRHLGSYAIPIEVSRSARDGDILLINEKKLQTYHEKYGMVTVSPDIIHSFVAVYKKTQRYVYNVLRGDFASIYPNYNSFIRFLTIYLTLGGCLNEFMHKSTKMIYMNNEIANDYFTLYGLPSVIMESNSLVKFLKQFRKLLMDKGTNVVYRVKDIIGYEYTDIFTLVMVKQQVYKDGYPVFHKDKTTGEMIPKQNVVFRRFGTAEDNTSYFQFRDSNKTYTVEEITSGDPRWWNTPEVERMIQEMNYTLSNSKYIQLSTGMSMDDIWWQTCILLRGLLDHKNEIRFSEIGISQTLNGISKVSVYEAVLILIILMNWNHSDDLGRYFNGDLYLPNKTVYGLSQCVDMLFDGLYPDGAPKPYKYGWPFKVSSFNFDIRDENNGHYEKLSEYEYLEPDVFMPMLNRILDREDVNVGEVIMTNLKTLFEYLKKKLRTSSTIHEFRQVTDAYNWLFLVDPLRDWDIKDQQDTEQLLLESYGMNVLELSQLKSFYRDTDNTDGYVTFTYHGIEHTVSIYEIMNQNVLSLTKRNPNVYAFDQSDFVNAFNKAIDKWRSITITTSNISNVIKTNYRNIIKDKVMLDISNSKYGPRSFEALLYRENPALYRYLENLKSDPDTLLILMRSIIKSLETYIHSPLGALEFEALGQEQYIYILKEVITYFKSYMVEFTKAEFRCIMDGLFDHGGNSNMLLLFDEIAHYKLRVLPRDALHLYDVSHATVRLGVKEDMHSFFNDEAIFRLKTTYKKIKEMSTDSGGGWMGLGWAVYYDHNGKMDQTPFEELRDNDIVIAHFVPGTYKCIIHKEDINPVYGNYYGNTR